MPADGGRYGHNSGADKLRALLRARFADGAYWRAADGRTVDGRGQRDAIEAGLVLRYADSSGAPIYVLSEQGEEFINAGR